MAIRKSKAEQLADKVAQLQKEIEATKAAEAQAADEELLDLVHRAGCMREVTEFVRKLIDQQRAERARKAG